MLHEARGRSRRREAVALRRLLGLRGDRSTDQKRGPATGRAGRSGSVRLDHVEIQDVEFQAVRETLQKDVEAFVAAGGKIEFLAFGKKARSARRKTPWREPVLSSRMSRDGPCSVRGCSRPIQALGFCSLHRHRHLKGLPMDAPRMRNRVAR